MTDNEWCADMGSLGASCFHTLSDKTQDIPKPEWDKKRFGMLCTDSSSFANWKEAILKLCHSTKKCTNEEIETINQLSEKVNSIIQRLN